MENNTQVINMINAIRSLKLVEYVRDFDDKQGFMWTRDQHVVDIGNAVLSDGHSGCSFACTLRECQYLFRNPTELDTFYNNNKSNTVSESVEPTPETENKYEEGTDVKKGSGKDYMFYEGMDDHNREAMDVAASKGMRASIEFMTKDLANGNMSYAEFRSRYG